MKERLTLVCIFLALCSCLSGCVVDGAASAQPQEPVAQPLIAEGGEVDLTPTPYVTRTYKTVDTITPSLREPIADMKELNEDVVGWLMVPGTDINDVIVQNPQNKNNNYYLNHNFYGQPDPSGVFCADRRCDFTSGLRENLSRNVTLYGHSWDDDPDGELFGQLKRFKDPAFAREHPYIYFSTEEEDMVWEIFAVYEATIHFPYVWPDLDHDTFRQVLDVVYESSYYDYGTTITHADNILTLSTCTFEVGGRDPMPVDEENDYRFVVMARLVESDEELKLEATMAVKDKSLPPDLIPMDIVANQVDPLLANKEA